MRCCPALAVRWTSAIRCSRPGFQTALRLPVVFPPVAVDGPMVTIRKFSPRPIAIDDQIRFGSLSVEAASFLQACVLARANFLISGGSSSGKTTLLNGLSASVPDNERIVTIEECVELRLQQGHVCRLESFPAGEKGKDRS